MSISPHALSSAAGRGLMRQRSFGKDLRPHLDATVALMMQYAKEESLEDKLRSSAVEVLISLCEQAGPTVRKHKRIPTQLIPVLISWTSRVEDDPEWSKVAEEQADDSETLATVGEQGLDRVALALGGATVLPVVKSILGQLVADPKWNYRLAALVTIGAIAEGCEKAMRPILKDIVAVTVPRLIDPHPRVRFAACNAVGQLALDFAPDPLHKSQKSFQELYHEQVMPTLMKLMKDVENPRVQAHSAAALTNVAEHMKAADMLRYSDGILGQLALMLQSSHRLVIDQAVTATAMVADACRKDFSKYYSHFMTALKGLLAKVPTTGDRKVLSLRGKVIDTLSHIAVVVGKEVFAPDAAEVLALFAHSQKSLSGDDDPQAGHLMAAWARMCEVLKEDFVRSGYLAQVMAPLFAKAAVKVDVQFFDTEPTEAELGGSRAHFEVINVDSKCLAIKTSAIEDKRLAIEMITVYVKHLGGQFGPFIEPAAKVVLEEMTAAIDEGTRIACAAIVPHIITATFESPQHGAQQANLLWQKMAVGLLTQLEKETDPDVLSWQYDAIEECLKKLGAGAANTAFVTKLVGIMTQELAQLNLQCDEMAAERAADVDYDATEAERAVDESALGAQAILEGIDGVVRVLFATYRGEFLPAFDQLKAEVQKLLQPAPARTCIENKWGISMYDDLIEFAGDDPRAAPFVLEVKDAFTTYALHADGGLRQAVAYGFGMMAARSSAYDGICKEALPKLFAVAAERAATADMDARENAVSAIVRIFQTSRFGMDPAT